MASSPVDIDTPRRGSSYRAFPMAATALVLAGCLACLNTSDQLVDGADTAGLRFAGVVREYVDNSDGAAGDEDGEVWTEGEFALAGTGFAAGDVGKTVFLLDNQTVGLADAAGVDQMIPVGVITEVVSSTEVWVQITPNLGKAQDALGPPRQYTIEIAGVNATAFDLDASAALFGGAGFYVRSVQAVRAIVTSTGAAASPLRKVVTTHWTLASGVISAVGDETLNTWQITFLGNLT